MAIDEAETDLLSPIDGLFAATKAIRSAAEQLVLQGAGAGTVSASYPAEPEASTVSLPAVMTLSATSTGLTLTAAQRSLCERIINVFETGTVEGKYGAISIFNDGPNRIRQVTYGRSQTTEYGNLRELVKMYVDAGGTFSSELAPFVEMIGVAPLVDNTTFKNLLKRAGNEDPVMRQTQDSFFERRYFQPAMKWAAENGFAKALSALVIYDSFIHSGRIRQELRQMFSERPPASGGDEKIWISEYLRVRHDWLTNHSNPQVRPSNYRTKDLKREAANNNWDLAIVPIIANGVAVRPAAGLSNWAVSPAYLAALSQEATPANEHDVIDEWSEAEPPASGYPVLEASVAANVGSAASIAADILADSDIKLATAHVSGVKDDAMARDNIVDTAAGRKAKRSSYGNAPGGSVQLDSAMLDAMRQLGSEYRFSVSEICGASHSPTSKHYAGVAFDVNVINGQHVRNGHPDQLKFRARCAALGAVTVLGPGDPDHATHIHAAWPV